MSIFWVNTLLQHILSPLNLCISILKSVLTCVCKNGQILQCKHIPAAGDRPEANCSTSFSLVAVIPKAGTAVFTIAVSSIFSTLVACCCRLFRLLVAKEAVVKHNSYYWSRFSVNGHYAFEIYRWYGNVSGECHFSGLITLHSFRWTNRKQKHLHILVQTGYTI